MSKKHRLFDSLGFGYNMKKFINPGVSFEEFKAYMEMYMHMVDSGEMLVVDKLDEVDFIYLSEYLSRMHTAVDEQSISDAVDILGNPEEFDSPLAEFNSLWAQFYVLDHIVYLTTKSEIFGKEN